MRDEWYAFELRRQRCVPVFPDGFVSKVSNLPGNLIRRTVVCDIKLARSPFAPFTGLTGKLNDATFLRAMKIFCASTRVTPWLRVAPGAHEGYPKRDQAIAQWLGFPCGQDDSSVRKKNPKSADELCQFTIRYGIGRIKTPGTGSKAGE